MKKLSQYTFAFVLLGCLALPAKAQPDSRVDFSQVTRPVVQINEPQLITFMLDALIILTEEDTEMLEIIDITSNGFGPDDVVVVHPTMETHKLPPVLPADVQDLMNSWQLEANTQYDGANATAEVYNPEMDPQANTSEKKAEQAILYDLLRTLERNYLEQPISILFERDDEAFSFQMWDFEQQSLRYTPPPPAQPDTVNAYDMLYVVRNDSLIISDTTMFDVFFVSKKIEETIWMPEIPEDPGLKVPADAVRREGPGQ